MTRVEQAGRGVALVCGLHDVVAHEHAREAELLGRARDSGDGLRPGELAVLREVHRELHPAVLARVGATQDGGRKMRIAKRKGLIVGWVPSVSAAGVCWLRLSVKVVFV